MQITEHFFRNSCLSKHNQWERAETMNIFVLSKKRIKSCLNSCLSFNLKDESIECVNNLLLTSFEDTDVNVTIPWDVAENCIQDLF